VTVTTMEGLGEQAEECRWVIAGDDSETRAMLFLHLKYDFHSENYVCCYEWQFTTLYILVLVKTQVIEQTINLRLVHGMRACGVVWRRADHIRALRRTAARRQTTCGVQRWMFLLCATTCAHTVGMFYFLNS